MKLLYKPILFFIVPLFILSACSPSFKLGNYDDPYENVNRKSHDINKAIDKKVLRPSSKAYSKVLAKSLGMLFQTFLKIGGCQKI